MKSHAHMQLCRMALHRVCAKCALLIRGCHFIIAVAILLGMGICMAGCGDREREGDTIILQNESGASAEDGASENPANASAEDNASENPIESYKEISTDDSYGGAGRIVCWGDSLTYGQGGEGVTYPSVLAEELGMETINYGIQGETIRQIAIRAGLLMMTTDTFTIPADTSRTAVQLRLDGEDPTMMRLGDCGINPCCIGGVEGTLSYDAADGNYYFARNQAGTAVQVGEGTAVETFASQDKRPSDIVILFAGTNLPPDKDTVGELIDMEQRMLDYLGSDRYLVIGLTSLELVPDVVSINESLAEVFGEHFLDIRAYLLENGLADAGMAPTAQDQEDLAAGEIPSSLRVDVVHGNASFYRIIGEQAANKLADLGYVAKRSESLSKE